MDGRIGQMMEPLELHPAAETDLPPKDWALTGCDGRDPQLIRSLLLEENVLEDLNITLRETYEEIRRDWPRPES